MLSQKIKYGGGEMRHGEHGGTIAASSSEVGEAIVPGNSRTY